MKIRAALAVAFAVSILALPLAGEPQQATKVWRIGYLGYAYPSQARDLDVFRERLRDLGYVERKNLVIESRSAGSSFERLPELVAELVNLKVDVIAAIGNRTIVALMRATQTIPIVMISAGDPVGTGLVSSLARPGGNVAGLSNLAEGLSAKWLELLTETSTHHSLTFDEGWNEAVNGAGAGAGAVADTLFDEVLERLASRTVRTTVYVPAAA